MRTVEAEILSELELVLLVHGPSAPADADWERAIRTFRSFGVALRARGAKSRCLVWTPSGHGPNAKQRRLLDETNTGLSPRVAVVSGSVMARGIVTAISWIGHTEIVAYSPDQLDEALAFLDIPSRHYPLVRRSLQGTEARLVTQAS
jgi:hypothetical protein